MGLAPEFDALPRDHLRSAARVVTSFTMDLMDAHAASSPPHDPCAPDGIGHRPASSGSGHVDTG
jgi:hypothetical protein